MNQLTTIAALPSGAGCAACLSPEVGKAASYPVPGEFADMVVRLLAAEFARRLHNEIIASIEPGSTEAFADSAAQAFHGRSQC